MERLIADANEYAASIGEASDLSIESFADIVTAIDLIQQKQNIAGTTAKESMTTISGSIRMIQNAWQNLLTQFGTGDVTEINNSVQGIVEGIFGVWSDETKRREGGLINNALPIVSNIGKAISYAIPNLVYSLYVRLKGQLAHYLGLGDLWDADIEIPLKLWIQAIGKAILSGLANYGKTLYNIGKSLGESFVDGLGAIKELAADALDIDVDAKIPEWISAIVEKIVQFIDENAGKVIDAGGKIATWLVDGIRDNFGIDLSWIFDVFESISTFVSDFATGFTETLGMVDAGGGGALGGGALETALQGITDVISSLWNIIDVTILQHGEEIGSVIATIATVIGDVITGVGEFLTLISPYVPTIVAAVGTFAAITTAISAVSGAITFVTTVIIPAIAAIESVGTAVSVIVGILGGPVTIIATIVAAIVTFIATNEDARNAVLSVWNAICEWFAGLPEFFSNLWNNIVQGVTDFVNGVGEKINSLKDGIAQKFEEVVQWFTDLPQNILNTLGDLGQLLVNAGSDIIDGLLNGIQSAFSGVADFVGGIGDWIAEHKGPKEYDLKLLIPNGGWIMRSLGIGMRKGLPALLDEIKDITSQVETAMNVESTVTMQAASATTNGQVIDLLNAIYQKVGNDIYLDGDTLVGSTVSRMNTALGRY